MQQPSSDMDLRVEPDLANCRLIPLGRCVPGTDIPLYYCHGCYYECRYALVFAYECLCQHPDRETFPKNPPLDS